MTSSLTLRRIMTFLGVTLVGAAVLSPNPALPENAPITLPIETVAHYIHAVIEAAQPGRFATFNTS